MARIQRSNLPDEMTSFVGRRQELAEVERLLRSATRLVTLIGVGGAGKKRLALRVAGWLQRSFGDGVWLVELAALPDSTLLARTVADVLGVRDHSARPPLSVLAESLSDMRVLLVLDSCEHVLDGCVELVTTLLAAAPGLTVLATSRNALGIRGEHIFLVPALPLPDLSRRRARYKSARSDAVRLFVERARAVVPGLTVDHGGRTTIARICHRLGGLPLAIEMAAVWARFTAPEQILWWLDDRLRLLTGGSPSTLSCHQTLQVVIDRSYALCSEDEQVLWARVSVFAGGFDLDAAEVVCVGGGIEPDQVMDLVGGLVDKSVLVRESHGSRARFRMLDIVREYGLDRLSAIGEEAAVRERHCEYYLKLAERNEREWFGPSQAGIFEQARLELTNLRVALDFCLASPGKKRAGLWLASTLWFFWVGCGMLGEGRHWLDRMLAADRAPSRERAKALWVNGYVSTLQGDVGAAVAMLEECRSCATDVNDRVALAYATHQLGSSALACDEVESAETLFEEAQARYLRLGEMNSNVLMAWVGLGVAAVCRGNFDRAVAMCQEACAIGEEHGELWAHAYAIWTLALVALNSGEVDEATARASECLRVKRTFNDLLGIAMAIEVLAWCAAAQGRPDRAGTLLGAAARIGRSVGLPLFGSRHFGAPHKDCEAAIRRALGDGGFDATFGRGTAYTVDEAIAYALDDEHCEPPRPSQVGGLTTRPAPPYDRNR